MKLSVQNQKTKQQHTLQQEPSDQVQNLLNNIAQTCGLDPSLIRLYFGNKILASGTLAENNICDNDCVVYTVKPTASPNVLKSKDNV
jgi:hypothetical protein